MTAIRIDVPISRAALPPLLAALGRTGAATAPGRKARRREPRRWS